MMVDHTPFDGDEMVCVNCGHRSYGLGFQPLNLEEAMPGRLRRREPRHEGSRL